MEYILSKASINTLALHKNLPLLNYYNLCYIVDYEIGDKEIIKKHWFKGPTTKKVKILTKYIIKVFNRKEKFVGVMEGEDALNWLSIHNIYDCRNNYLKVKEGLEGFGHKLISDQELRKEKLKQENDTSTLNPVS